VPTTLILKPSGEVIARHEGFADAEVFRTFLEAALRRHGCVPKPGVAPPQPEAVVALAGYCPVSLVKNQRLVPGTVTVTLEHDGHVYRFANPSQRNLFQKYPERFTPLNGGHCPVSQVDRGEFVAGDPRWGVLYHGHLYLCAGAAGRDRFLRDPERYARVGLTDRALCPHCWSADGLSLRSQPRAPIARSVLRSPFADLLSLDAPRMPSAVTR
jgi:YHS domain-containing protein